MHIVDVPTKRKLKKRTSPIKAVVVHTTGDTDLQKIINFYTSPSGFQPHYMIAYDGTIRRFVAENLVAYHAAWKPNEAAAYAKGFAHWSERVWNEKLETADPYNGFFPGYAGWRDKWHAKGKESPGDLITGAQPNLVSIGIELQQPVKPTKDIFYDAQYTALGELLTDITYHFHVPLDVDHVLGHYDVGPMRRTRANSPRGWDPGTNFNWARLFASVPQLCV